MAFPPSFFHFCSREMSQGWMDPSVGHLNGFFARVGGNLNNNFQKSQMPGGLPGGGMLKLRFDRYITIKDDGCSVKRSRWAITMVVNPTYDSLEIYMPYKTITKFHIWTLRTSRKFSIFYYQFLALFVFKPITGLDFNRLIGNTLPSRSCRVVEFSIVLTRSVTLLKMKWHSSPISVRNNVNNLMDWCNCAKYIYLLRFKKRKEQSQWQKETVFSEFFRFLPNWHLNKL